MTNVLGRLSASDRRALTLGAVSLSALLLVSRGVPALLGWHHEIVASAASATDSASRFVALASLGGSAAGRATSAHGIQQALDRVLIHDSVAEPLAVALAKRVRSVATDAGADVASIEIDGDTAHVGSLSSASVRLDASGDLDSITRMVEAFEYGPPALSIDEVLMVPTGSPAPGSTEPAIHAQLLVRGVGLPSLVPTGGAP